jgi:hypothetical protein
LDDPSTIRAALVELAATWGVESPLETAQIFTRWETVVGHELAARCRPTSLKGGVLRVRMESAVWASELRYLADEIIQRVNREVGSRVVRELKPWVATRKEAEGPSGRGQKHRGGPGTQSARHAAGDGGEEPSIGREIEDQALAKALKRAFRAAQNTEKTDPPVVYWDKPNEATGAPRRPSSGP